MPKRGHQPRGVVATIPDDPDVPDDPDLPPDDPGNPPPPPDPGTLVLSLSTTSPLQGGVVTVTAQYAATDDHAPIARSGIIVTWGKIGAGGTFSSATSLTNVVGVATVQFTAGAIAGATYTIVANALINGVGITGQSATITVTADNVPTAIAITPTSFSLAIGGTRQMTATLRNAVGTIVSLSPTAWVSSDETIATVSATGLVTAVAAGSFTIYARYGSVTSNSASATVTADVGPNSITIVGLNVPLSVGTVQMTASVKNAAGVVILGATPTGWTSSDPTVARITNTGLLTVLKVGSTSIQATLGAIMSNTVTVTVTPISVTTNAVLELEGPTIPSSAMAGLGLTWYEALFAVNAEQQWLDFGPAWNAGNTISEYERPATYWIWALRTGDQKWYDRGIQMLLNYRDEFLLPNNADPFTANPSPHFSEAESLYLHWKLTGDPRSRDAAIGIANHYIAFALNNYLSNLGLVESRIQARVIMAFYVAVLILGENARPSTDSPTTYGNYLDTVIADTLASLNSDGYGPFTTTCGGSLNYQGAMLYDVLTRIYDRRPGSYNATILSKCTAFANFAWNTQWRGGGDRPLVGCIRFDDWSSDPSKPSPDGGALINVLLTTPAFTNRWPYYVNAAGPSMDESPQSIMDHDILAAKNAGIDFWIFQSFATAGRYGWDNFLASPYKGLMKFAKMEQSLSDLRRAMTISGVADAQYLTFGGRPVVFFLMGYINQFATPSQLVAYRAEIIAAGHPNPYFVGMENDPVTMASYMASWDLDAGSGYVGGVNGLSAGLNPYSLQVSLEEAEWTTFKNTGYKMVPTVTTGWDPRQSPGGVAYTGDATPAEIATHLRHGVDFVKANPTACPSKMLVLSAWNEFTENHFIAPTYVNGNADGNTSRLDAIGSVMHGPAVGEDASFNYISVFCSGTGSSTAAPDLNGIMTVPFAWLYKTTGDSSWKAKADTVFDGMQASAGIYLYRQFSEQFSDSYRTLGYTHDDLIIT